MLYVKSRGPSPIINSLNSDCNDHYVANKVIKSLGQILALYSAWEIGLVIGPLPQLEIATVNINRSKLAFFSYSRLPG